MKIRTAFTLAKKHLSHDRLQGICSALHGVENVPESAYDMISERIRGFALASSWLAAQMIGERGHSDRAYARRAAWVDRQGPEAIQAWRHAWLDQLIAELKAKGD